MSAPPPRYLGAHVKRLEDPRLLAGRGRFLDDITLPGVLHAAFVRSEYAHAVLRRVDGGPARALPGVEAVLTGRDLDGQVAPLTPRFEAPGLTPTAWPALATARVRFVGEPVAVIAAATPYVAVDGCGLVTVEYEPLRAVPDLAAALDPDAPRLHPGQPSNV
ncbi:MAG: hypothetical protein ACREKB_03095, partial [Candidatus Rokuibacteriota bacterium]